MSWFNEALDECEGDVEKMRRILRYRSAIGALITDILPRDRWGYPLKAHELARVCEYVVPKLDHMREEVVEALGLAMMIDEVPLICMGYDTPPDDDFLTEIVQKIDAATTRRNP